MTYIFLLCFQHFIQGRGVKDSSHFVEITVIKEREMRDMKVWRSERKWKRQSNFGKVIRKLRVTFFITVHWTTGYDTIVCVFFMSITQFNQIKNDDTGDITPVTEPSIKSNDHNFGKNCWFSSRKNPFAWFEVSIPPNKLKGQVTGS